MKFELEEEELTKSEEIVPARKKRSYPNAEE